MQKLVTGLGLAPTTVAIVYSKLNTLFESAVEDGLLARNPATGVRLPPRAKGEVVPPTAAQVGAVYEAAVEWLRPAVILGAGLGLRAGEACGLTADRVLCLERAVRIDRQWLSRHGANGFGPPKSAASSRTVPASDWVLDGLAAHVGRRHEGFVVHRGGAGRRQRLRLPLAKGGEGGRGADAAVPRAAPHLRQHADLGRGPKAVQHARGHASAATTLNVYAHLWPGDDEVIRQAVDRALGQAAEDSLGPGARRPRS